MSTNPLVSIIIPVYNMEKYLAECLDSVINQTYRNLEIIIVNDGSTDGSAGIIDEYSKRDERIRVITKENGGASSARNAGINMAEGGYLFFVDSDDYLETDAIEKLHTAIAESDADLVTFECRTFSSTDNVNPDIYKRTLGREVYSGHEYFSYCQSHNEFHPTIWLHFYRRELFEKRRFIEGIVYEDTPFTFELMASDVTVLYIPDVLVNHRMESGSVMRSKMSNQKVRSNIVGVKYMADVYLKDEKRTPEMKKFVQWCASTHYSGIRQLNEYDSDSKALNSEFRKYLMQNKWLFSKGMLKEFTKLLVNTPNRIF